MNSTSWVEYKGAALTFPQVSLHQLILLILYTNDKQLIIYERCIKYTNNEVLIIYERCIKYMQGNAVLSGI